MEDSGGDLGHPAPHSPYDPKTPSCYKTVMSKRVKIEIMKLDMERSIFGKIK